MERGGSITWVLDADDAKFIAAMLRARTESRATARAVDRNFSRTSKSVDSNLEQLRKRISITANVARDFQTVMMGFNMTSFIAGIVAAGAVVVELGATLIAAAGAAVAIPGIFAAVSASALTIRLAFDNMSKAIKAINSGDPEALAKAMAKLGPASKSVVSAFKEISDAFQPIKFDLQEKFFAGLGDEMLQTAKVSMPVLKNGLDNVAIATNGLLKEVARVSREPFFQGTIAKVFDATATSTTTLTKAVEPLSLALSGLIQVGLPYTNMLSEWIVKLSQAAGAYLSSAQGQQDLTNVINIGIDALQKIFNLAGALTKVLVDLFQLSNKEGLSFIGTITDALNRFDAFLRTAEGQEKFQTLFKVSNEILGQSVEVIGRVAKVILDLFDAIDKLPGPMREFIINLAASGIVMAPIIGYLTTLGVSLKALFLSVGTGVKGVLSLVNGLRALAVGFQLASTGATIAEAGGFAKFGAVLFKVFDAIKIFSAFITTNLIPALFNLAKGWLVALGPIGIIIAIIATLVGVFIYLYNNVEGFRNFWNGVWKGIQDVVAGVVSWFAGNVVPFFAGLWKGAQDGAAAFGQFWVDLWNGFTGTVSDVWNGIVSVITTGVTNVLNFLKPLFDVINGIIYIFTALGTIVFTIFSTIAQVVAIVVSTLVQIIGVILIGTLMWLWNNVLVPLGQVFVDVWNTIVNAVSTAVNAIIGFVVPIFQAIWDFIVGAVTGIYNTIVTIFTLILNTYIAIWTAIFNFIMPILQGIWDFIVSVFNGIWNTISGVLNTIFSIVSSVFGNTFNTVRDIFNNIWNTIRNSWNNVVNTVREGITNAYNTVTGFVGKFLQAGKDIIDGIVRGVQQGGQAVVNTVTNIAKGALDAVKNFFGIHSPSKVMANMGNFMMEGLQKGLEQTGQSVIDTATSVAQGIYGAFAGIDGTSVSANVNGNMTGVPDLAPAAISAQDMPTAVTTGSGVSITQNNTVNTEIDMDKVLRDMTWELGRA